MDPHDSRGWRVGRHRHGLHHDAHRRGRSQVIALQFTVHPATSHRTLTNTAVATASNPDLVPANNTATAVTDVILGPTPVTSNLPNAAVPTPSTGVPMAIFGFAALLFGLLSVPAVVSVRRNRPDQPLIPAGRHD